MSQSALFSNNKKPLPLWSSGLVRQTVIIIIIIIIIIGYVSGFCCSGLVWSLIRVND